ncbi:MULTISPECIES: redoxin domain-containing protein [unclassified Saccharothrix]|uniref:redoxin domain-containing protein n=1 Tax=unclassified Saccharothrix TaxID=2593673 RepID=UPI00307D5ABC
MIRSRSPRTWLVGVASLAVLAACGAPTSTGGAATAPTTVVSTTSVAETTASGAAREVPEKLRFSAKTVDGAQFSGESLAGKPAVLWFWAPWCPKCQREAPGIASSAKDNASVTFLGVAALDKEPAMRDFVQRFQLGGFTHLADVDSEVWKRFGVTAQPAYAFIGRDGAIDVVTKQLTEQELRERVAALAVP